MEAEAEASETEAAERRTAIEAMVNQLKRELEAKKEEKLEQQCSVQSIRQELDSDRKHAEEAERRCVQLEHEAVDREREAELHVAVACSIMAEKRQWESREARLVQRLQELESRLLRQLVSLPVFQTVLMRCRPPPLYHLGHLHLSSSQKAEARQPRPEVEPGDTGQNSPVRPVHSRQLD